MRAYSISAAIKRLFKTSSPPPPPSHVAQASGNLIYVKVGPATDIPMLHSLGFSPDPKDHRRFVAVVSSDVEKGRLFAALRDNGILFSYGREWNPAEVFEYLKEQGYVKGPFKIISWRRPGDWITRDSDV